MYYLGIDLGSSSLKIALVGSESGELIKTLKEPEAEMQIDVPHIDWAEQDPMLWWKVLCKATNRIIYETGIQPDQIKGIGISYQMHGLVLLNEESEVLRPAIIWCDSRAVGIGDKAFSVLGESYCMHHLLNSPGNFTMSKLRWVKEHEPDVYAKIWKFLLPGDFLAFMLSGDLNTTVSGLTEGIAWDFHNDELAEALFRYYDIEKDLVPNIVNTFSVQGRVSESASRHTGLAKGTPLLYRAGDQPNNALSLNVFEPGEVAGTAGTSGVIYAISDRIQSNESVRLNTFAHVNYHNRSSVRLGKILNINGVGIMLRWLKDVLRLESYSDINNLATGAPIGSDGLVIHPYGNGAERMFENINTGAQWSSINFNKHTINHICRAALEGVAYSFKYGSEILKSEGLDIKILRVGNDNMFQSSVFAKTVSTILDVPIEVYDTTGAIGAARACCIHESGINHYKKMSSERDYQFSIHPDPNNEPYLRSYEQWKNTLIDHIIN